MLFKRHHSAFKIMVFHSKTILQFDVKNTKKYMNDYISLNK